MANTAHNKTTKPVHATPCCEDPSSRLNAADTAAIDRLCDHVCELYAAVIQLTEHITGSATCSKAVTNEESV